MKTDIKKHNKKKHVSYYFAQLQESLDFYLLSPSKNQTRSRSFYKAIKTWIDDGILSMTPTKAQRMLRLFKLLSYTHNTSPPRVKKSKLQNFKGSAGFLAMLAQKENPNPVFNFTDHKGKSLPDTTVQQIKDLYPETDLSLSFKPLELGPSSAAQPIGLSPKGGRYYLDMENSKARIYRKQSPKTTSSLASPHRLQFKGLKLDEKTGPLFSDETSKVERFEFTVNKTKLLKRVREKRPCSQKKLFGGTTALDYLLFEIGLILSKKQNGRNFHWAHREGWSLGGAQEAANIDAMTAGANYATLFKVEDPIKKMLFEGFNGNPPVENVRVKGKVIFAKGRDVPFKIIYKLFWGDHKLKIFIDPLSDRVPTLKENEVTKKYGWALEMEDEFPCLS